jgi:hypothetical protein
VNYTDIICEGYIELCVSAFQRSITKFNDGRAGDHGVIMCLKF